MENIIGLIKRKEMNKNKKWNPDEWQGRSRENVEASYKFTFIAFVGMIVTFVIAAIVG